MLYANWLMDFREAGKTKYVGSKHHILPRFYIDFFKGKSGKVSTLNLTSGKLTKLVDAKNVLVERDFYTFIETDYTPNSSIEMLLSGIEDICNQTFKLLISRVLKFPLQPMDLECIALFAASQTLRGRNSRRRFEIIGNALVKENIYQKAMKRNSDSRKSDRTAFDDKDLAHSLQDVVFLPSTNDHLNYFVNRIVDFTNMLLEREVILLELSKPCLITSDEPILSVIGDEYADSAFMIAEEIVFPLTPRHLVLFGKPNSRGQSSYIFLDKNKFDSKSFNEAIVKYANELIIMNPDFQYRGVKKAKKSDQLVKVSGLSKDVEFMVNSDSKIRRPFNGYKPLSHWLERNV